MATPHGRPLPYGRQTIEEQDIAAVVDCLRGDWLTQGPRVEAMERALCDLVGAAYGVAVANGTLALELACRALGVGGGDLVICPAISFVATANCARVCGAEVVFADVDPRSGLIDPVSIDEQCADLARSPKLLIPVDFAGQPADLAQVKCVANRYGASVLRDAAHALGAADGIVDDRTGTVQVSPVGAGRFADATTFSFHPVKPITTAEGGAIVTDHPQVAATLRRLRTHGIQAGPAPDADSDDPLVGPWCYRQLELGTNARISDLQCALGLAQLQRLESWIGRRGAIAQRYDRALAQEPFVGRIAPLARRADTQHGHHLYVVQVRDREKIEEIAHRRRALYLHLREREIYSQVHYIPIYRQPYYRERYGECRLPGAERYYAASLSLPIFPGMDDDDCDRVVSAIADFLRQ